MNRIYSREKAQKARREIRRGLTLISRIFNHEGTKNIATENTENLDTDSFDKLPSGLSLRVEDRTGYTGFLQQVQDR